MIVGDKAKAHWARVGAGEDFDIEANERFYSDGRTPAGVNASLMAHQRLILSVIVGKH